MNDDNGTQQAIAMQTKDTMAGCQTAFMSGNLIVDMTTGMIIPSATTVARAEVKVSITIKSVSRAMRPRHLQRNAQPKVKAIAMNISG